MYSIIFMIPAATILMHSRLASDLVIILLFVVAVWNGGNFYVEVFGRKFEKELEALKREMDVLTNSIASGPSTPHTETGGMDSAPQSRPLSSAGTGGFDSTPIDFDGKLNKENADRVDQAVKQRKGTGLDNSPLVLPQAETSEPPEMKLDGKKEV